MLHVCSDLALYHVFAASERCILQSHVKIINLVLPRADLSKILHALYDIVLQLSFHREEIHFLSDFILLELDHLSLGRALLRYLLCGFLIYEVGLFDSAEFLGIEVSEHLIEFDLEYVFRIGMSYNNVRALAYH